MNDLDDLSDHLRRLVLERTRRLLELDDALRNKGEPGVLQRGEEDLPRLEQEMLGPTPVAGPPDPDALTDAERRTWVRQNFRVLLGGLNQTSN